MKRAQLDRALDRLKEAIGDADSDAEFVLIAFIPSSTLGGSFCSISTTAEHAEAAHVMRACAERIASSAPDGFSLVGGRAFPRRPQH